MPDTPKPLKELLEVAERDMDGWEAAGPEMARRLRALDDYVGKLTPQMGRHIRCILEGGKP